MGPNRGYQHIMSAGIYVEIGPLSIQLKPEYLYSENKDFEGFGEGPNGHYSEIWAKKIPSFGIKLICLNVLVKKVLVKH